MGVYIHVCVCVSTVSHILAGISLRIVYRLLHTQQKQMSLAARRTKTAAGAVLALTSALSAAAGAAGAGLSYRLSLVEATRNLRAEGTKTKTRKLTKSQSNNK